MKKHIFFFLIFGATLINYSCDDSINPNAPFRERYILNGIMRCDTSYQIVTLSHSYQPEGLDPLEYSDDPAIKNADVNIYYDNKPYHMRDTVVVRTDASRYGDSVKYYYNSELKPDAGKVIEIDALLPNGLLLQSLCETPAIPNYGFFDYNSNKLVPPPFGTKIFILWQDLGNILYAPKLNINYYVKGDTIMYQKEVPQLYITDQNGRKPIFPTPTKNNYFSIELETISQALNEIPSGGQPKNQYTIANMSLDLIVYDEYLSKYYSSIKQGLDGFTVKLDNPDYSNIKGGFGIFGSYIKTTFTISFKSDYLKSVGY